MKKTVKIMSIVLLTIMLVATIAGTAYADVAGTIDEVIGGGSDVDTTMLTGLGGTIVTIIQVVGVVIAIIIILIIGIKYMIGSAEEKAEYKKTMIPYIVGAVLIFAGTSIVKVVYSIISQAKV